MKVLMIEHFLPFNSYSKELSKSLSKLVNLTVLTKRNYVDDGKVNWNVKPCLNIADSKNKFYTAITMIIAWIYIIKELLFGGYEIVHVQTFHSRAIEMFIYKHLAKGRLVYTVHNILPHESSGKEKEQYKKWYQSCDLLIVHNLYCKDLLEHEYGISNKICIMPFGVYELNKQYAKTKEEKTHKELIQFGSIRKYKGIDILIQAIAELDEKIKDKIHVTIVGKQYKKLDPTDYKKMISDRNLESIISFNPDRISDEELFSMISNSDGCVFPYRNIYGSSAIMMAYAFDKPVIVSDIPTFIEETNNCKTGLKFRSEDITSLRDSIIEFLNLDEHDLEGFQAEIKKLVKEKYNWENSSKILKDAYSQIIEKLK